MRFLPIAATVLLLVGCKSTPMVYPPAHKVMVSGNTLIYEGMITGDAVLEAMRVVREGKTPIDKLKITSPGGEMAVGMEFGYFIKENDLDVEVSRLCFSACANYILPAAKSVVINPDSLLGWHGGAKQADALWMHSVPSKDKKQFLEYLNRLRIKETAFFGYVGVDQQITTYGQTLKTSCQKSKNTDGWYYSVADMKRMGIKNITVKGAGLVEEVDYKAQGVKGDTTNFDPEKVTSCLLENVFDS
ncbi:hypothetical protein [Vibrio sp. M260118]|uniref:hypothetical protein n=1 Tax=Vibrio sp. M260118 TaxID=3020896 RepID=UPI002F3E80F1